MSFTFKSNRVLSCTECIYVSKERHFGDDGECPLCGSESETTK